MERTLKEFEGKELEFNSVRTVNSIQFVEVRDICVGHLFAIRNTHNEHKNTTYATHGRLRLASHIQEGDGYYRIDFNINSAIYRMIRNIIGRHINTH